MNNLWIVCVNSNILIIPLMYTELGSAHHWYPAIESLHFSGFIIGSQLWFELFISLFIVLAKKTIREVNQLERSLASKLNNMYKWKVKKKLNTNCTLHGICSFVYRRPLKNFLDFAISEKYNMNGWDRRSRPMMRLKKIWSLAD